MLIVPRPNPSLTIKRSRVAFLTSAADTADLSEYTFGSIPFGEPRLNRSIIVAVGSRSNSNFRPITGVTIGGVAATEIIQITRSYSGINYIGIYRAKVPTGTSGSVVVSFAGVQDRCAIAVYRALNLGAVTPYTSTSDNPSASVSIPANQFAVACALTLSVTTATWSNMAEDVDINVETNSFTAASHVRDRTGFSGTVQCAFGSNTASLMAVGVFGYP